MAWQRVLMPWLQNLAWRQSALKRKRAWLAQPVQLTQRVSRVLAQRRQKRVR